MASPKPHATGSSGNSHPSNTGRPRGHAVGSEAGKEQQGAARHNQPPGAAGHADDNDEDRFGGDGDGNPNGGHIDNRPDGDHESLQDELLHVVRLTKRWLQYALRRYPWCIITLLPLLAAMILCSYSSSRVRSITTTSLPPSTLPTTTTVIVTTTVPADPNMDATPSQDTTGGDGGGTEMDADAELEISIRNDECAACEVLWSWVQKARREHKKKANRGRKSRKNRKPKEGNKIGSEGGTSRVPGAQQQQQQECNLYAILGLSSRKHGYDTRKIDQAAQAVLDLQDGSCSDTDHARGDGVVGTGGGGGAEVRERFGHKCPVLPESDGTIRAQENKRIAAVKVVQHILGDPRHERVYRTRVLGPRQGHHHV